MVLLVLQLTFADFIPCIRHTGMFKPESSGFGFILVLNIPIPDISILE